MVDDRMSQLRLRFTLPVLFWMTALLASAMAMFGIWGILAAVVVSGLWLSVWTAKNPAERFWSILFVGVSLLLFLALFLPTVGSGPISDQARCMFRTREILLGILHYEEANGHFPPPWTADANGKPMHSWRVLILPYVDEPELYAEYRFDEPWDGPNNSKLLSSVPAIYQCPCHPDHGQGLCHHAAIVGSETAWRTDPPMKLSDLEAGAGHTLLISETLKGIPWTQPTDLTVEEFARQARELGQSPGRFGHRNETLFTLSGRTLFLGFADGQLWKLSIPQEVDAIPRMASRFEKDTTYGRLGELMVQPRVKWPQVVSFSLFVAISLLPFLRFSRRAGQASQTVAC